MRRSIKDSVEDALLGAAVGMVVIAVPTSVIGTVQSRPSLFPTMAKILSLKLLSIIGAILCFASPSRAEISTITATGEYRMGDHDTRADAKRIALQDAKRLALEKAGTYLESITEVKNFQLDREEIRAYTAGIVEVTEQQTRSTMEGETTVVRVDVTGKINTSVVARQTDALRKN